MRKPIREVKLESMEDFDALPEGEWVYAPGGIRVPIVFDHLITIDGVQYVPLPPSWIRRVAAAAAGWIRARRAKRVE